ncbi:uncharacterized protein BDV14DRAFT_68118 [Aspergillus stella-maris]|uniref:uncharacterized protein n=1 Tax=Aspergillus stella-maris TaxID=1810926 RepID=UPI003CCD8ED5
MTPTPDTIFLLGREVERLVNAPYAPSLQDLYSLTHKTPSSVLFSWASRKPCHVGALVDVIVDGLARSRLASPLLTSFAREQGFRNDLLQRYPHLLDQFLQQSVEGSEAEIQGHPVCLSLLSSPLPRGIIPPASLGPFVMQMIERMKVNPCADTVRPLYQISSCLQASGVLFELPQEVMSCFQVELTKTLRNLDDHMGNLLCLATCSRLASFHSESDILESGPMAPTWLQNIRHFFGPKRGLKTMDLVVLRVILACSSSQGNLTAEQAAESIRLAISICDRVDQEQRERWIEGNSIKVAKLLEKINRDSIGHSVQMLGVSFLVSLIPSASLPRELVRASLDWLVSDNAPSVLEILPTQIIPRLVMACTSCSDQSSLEAALQYIISTLSTRSGDLADVAKIQISKLVLQGLRLSDLQSVGMALERYGHTINDLLDTFPRQAVRLSCEGSDVCYASALKQENDLLSDLSTFWAGVMLSQSMQQPSSSTEIATITGFMNKIKMLLPEPKCTPLQADFSKSRTYNSYPRAREERVVPRTDWRTGIRDVIAANTQTVNDSLMRKVEDICYDLEQRCGNIEAPLRLVEEQRDRHRSEAEQMKEQNHILEYQLQQASSTISDLREEMSRLAGHATSATERVDELSANLAQAKFELEELRRTSQDTLDHERESSRTREIDVIATLTERDERLDELREELKDQTEANEELRSKLASVSEEKSSSLEEIAAMKAELSALQTELEHNRETNAKKDKDIEELSIGKANVEELSGDLQEKLQEEVSQAQALRTTLHETTQRLTVEIEELRREAEIQSSRLAEEAAERNSEIMALQRTMEDAKADATAELQAKNKRIQHLERKVQNLREERAGKAREFSEAQQHISRLMGVMGFKPEPSETRTSGKQRPRPSSRQSQAVPMQTQTDPEAATLQSQEANVLAESTDSSTPRPTGRSPKRSRNSAFPSAQRSPQRPYTSSKKSRESTPRAGYRKNQNRQPLGEADLNSQPSQQSTEDLSCSRRDSFRGSQLNHQLDQNRLDDVDLNLDLEFSKDFVFTSTSMSEMNGHART